MTQPVRLLESSRSARTRALLRAGKGETPPELYSKRLLVGLGVGAGIGTLTSGASASLATGAKAGAVVSGAAASGAAASGATVGAGSITSGLGLVVAKWVAIGVLGGGLLSASADFALAPAHTPAATPRPVHARLGNNFQHAAARASATRPLLAESAKPPASAAPVQPPPPSPHGSSGAPASQLGSEVQLIDRTRRALAAGNAALALVELNAYESLPRTRVLDREARVLRIQALRKLGDHEAAEQLTAQYLRDFPGDAHGARLRSQTNAEP